ncbi:hypothetical protein [Dyadobacter sp. CY312]|uniref:hypothetical protein n=1 Tax=Dyadobacter sp. CY312 TaxID=2907303 RepID=UPI001F35D524|nr:hypothetical protein [Dyadobacter sp. CY312]MCE7039267.1 hypothetical protein [Dyadobacter sp. CY312]
MELKEIKSVTLYKFSDNQSKQIGIYVEPTGPGTGRLIISTQYRIFQRYFDGCNPDIHTFLTKQTLESIVGGLCDEDRDYDYLMKYLKDVWPLFVAQIKNSTINS